MSGMQNVIDSPLGSPETLMPAVAADETAPELRRQCQTPARAPSCAVSPAAW